MKLFGITLNSPERIAILSSFQFFLAYLSWYGLTRWNDGNIKNNMKNTFFYYHFRQWSYDWENHDNHYSFRCEIEFSVILFVLIRISSFQLYRFFRQVRVSLRSQQIFALSASSIVHDSWMTPFVGQPATNELKSISVIAKLRSLFHSPAVFCV